MHSKILFVALALVLTSCNSLKKPPDVDLCSLVWNGTLEASYGYCISYYQESNREYRIPAAELFQKKYIAISPDHYQQELKYIDYLTFQARKRCR